MISVPLPALTRGFSPFACTPGEAFDGSAVRTESVAAARMTATAKVRMAGLRENQIELAPVLLGGRALARPVGRVIELVGDLRRPVAAVVTVEQIALDRLAQTGGAAGAVRFPAWREHQGAPDRKVRLQQR